MLWVIGVVLEVCSAMVRAGRRVHPPRVHMCCRHDATAQHSCVRCARCCSRSTLHVPVRPKLECVACHLLRVPVPMCCCVLP